MSNFNYIVSFYAPVVKNKVEITAPKWWQFWEAPVETIIEWRQQQRFSISVTQSEGKELLRRQKVNPHNDNMWNILFRALSGQDSHNISMLQIEVSGPLNARYIKTNAHV